MPFIPGLNGTLDGFLAGLPPDVRDWLVKVITGRLPIRNGAELKRLIETLLLMGAGYKELIKVLWHMARLRLLDAEILARAIKLLEMEGIAGGAASGSGGAGSGAAGAGGAAAGGSTAVTAAAVVAVLAGILAWIIAIWELTLDVPDQEGTNPCGSGKLARLLEQKVMSVADSSWGARRSLKNALQQAQEVCDHFAFVCAGSPCAGGKTCKPVVVVERVHQSSYIFITVTTVDFRCMCYCV